MHRVESNPTSRQYESPKRPSYGRNALFALGSAAAVGALVWTLGSALERGKDTIDYNPETGLPNNAAAIELARIKQGENGTNGAQRISDAYSPLIGNDIDAHSLGLAINDVLKDEDGVIRDNKEYAVFIMPDGQFHVVSRKGNLIETPGGTEDIRDVGGGDPWSISKFKG